MGRSPLVLIANRPFVSISIIKHLVSPLPARDGGHNAHFIAVPQRSIEIVKKANVLIIHVNIEKWIELRWAFEEPGFDADGYGLEAFKGLGDIGAIGFDDGDAIGVCSQGRGNSDFHAHDIFFQINLKSFYLLFKDDSIALIVGREERAEFHPPAMAGTMLISSPSFNGVSRLLRKRISSSFT